MRSNSSRRLRATQLTFAAAVLALPTSAAFAASTTDPHARGPLAIHVTPEHVRAFKAVTIRGTTLRADSGERVVLEGRHAGADRWRTLRSGRIDTRGRFRFVVHLSRSGLLRVVPSVGAGALKLDGVALDTSATVRRVAVRARVTAGDAGHAVLDGGRVAVRGRVLPRAGHRRVVLQAHFGRRWRTVDRGATTRAGRFKLAYRATTGTNRRLRVLFAGDAKNARASARAGTVTVYQPALASWYYDAGLATGCGFNARYGVANKTLPCGTKVKFRDGGRTVMATVDDRGPYVAGRTWDLGQSTRAALGFVGVGTIWASVR